MRENCRTEFCCSRMRGDYVLQAPRQRFACAKPDTVAASLWPNKRFIKNYSRITQPLSRLTIKDQPFYFNTIYRQAFNKLKKRLVSTPLLTYFNLKQPLILETNTLDSIITSIYSQKQIDREQHPITYYLKTIVDTKLNYLIHNKKILAIISSFQHQ